MAKFIKIDNKIINVDHIVLMVESKRHSIDKLYTKIFLSKVPFPTETDLTLEEVYKLIEDCSKN